MANKHKGATARNFQFGFHWFMVTGTVQPQEIIDRENLKQKDTYHRR